MSIGAFISKKLPSLFPTFAWRSLRRNPRRTLAGLAAVAFGVASVIVSGGFVDALLIKLREDTIQGRLGHLQLADSRFAQRGLSEPYRYLIRSTAPLLDSISRLPGVRAVAPRLTVTGLASSGATTLAFSGDAIDPAKESGSAGLAIVAGSELRPDDEGAALLGEGLAASLGVAPGGKVILLVNAADGVMSGTEVTVRGTFSSISKQYDDMGLRLPFSTASRILHVNGAQRWLVFLQDTDLTEPLASRIGRMLPDTGYTLTTWQQSADFYNKTAELFRRQFGFIRSVIVGIIVLSILNTMTMNVLERTWEVGVMLALGDPRRRILALFAAEGALVGLLGSITGAIAGIALARILDTVGIPMPAPPGSSHGFTAGIHLAAGSIVGGALLGTAVAAVASLPPAFRASRLEIVDSLRHGR